MARARWAFSFFTVFGVKQAFPGPDCALFQHFLHPHQFTGFVHALQYQVEIGGNVVVVKAHRDLLVVPVCKKIRLPEQGRAFVERRPAVFGHGIIGRIELFYR